jgi:hypothetical protein
MVAVFIAQTVHCKTAGATATMPQQLDFTLPPFFVYIIESNRTQEIMGGFLEGIALQNVLKFSGVRVKYHTSVGKQDFPIQVRRAAEYAHEMGAFPILHISAHGNLRGIQLTTEELVTWRELAEMLGPLRHFSGGNYLLCLSACEGLGSCQVALANPDIPPFGVVGTSKVVDWSDNVIGYATFYHLLRKGKTIRQAIEGMKAASAHDTYSFVHGPSAVKAFESVFPPP